MLTTEQKLNRTKGVGASEAPMVMGHSDYLTPYQLWAVKTGRMEPPALDNNPMVYWGMMHEPTVALEYSNVTGEKLARVNQTQFHKEHTFLLCHPDRRIVGKRKLLECKFAHPSQWEKWGETGGDVIPLPYYLQVQQQLAVMGYDEADLAVLIGGYDFRIYPIERDEPVIQKIITETGIFWNHVITDTPPPLQNRKDVALMYPYDNGSYIEATTEIVELVENLKLIKAGLKEKTEAKEDLEKDLIMYFLDNERITHSGKVLATWKTDKAGSRRLLIK